jgi:hypothetical protein
VARIKNGRGNTLVKLIGETSSLGNYIRRSQLLLESDLIPYSSASTSRSHAELIKKVLCGASVVIA